MHTYRTAGGGGAGAGGSYGAAVVAAPIATNAIIVVLCGALGSRLEHSVIVFFCLTYLATLNASKTEPKHRTSLAVVQCERHASPQAAAPPAHTALLQGHGRRGERVFLSLPGVRGVGSCGAEAPWLWDAVAACACPVHSLAHSLTHSLTQSINHCCCALRSCMPPIIMRGHTH